jgi:hypothetical protein
MAKKEDEKEGGLPTTAYVPVRRPKEIPVPGGKPGETMSTEPTDLADYEGEYKYLPTGEVFGLKMVEDDPYGHTHHLKNVDHFWSGNEEDFRKNFEKS